MSSQTPLPLTHTDPVPTPTFTPAPTLTPTPRPTFSIAPHCSSSPGSNSAVYLLDHLEDLDGVLEKADAMRDPSHFTHPIQIMSRSGRPRLGVMTEIAVKDLLLTST